MAGPSFVWAECDAEIFAHSLSAAYSEVVKWKPNTFSIPFGNSGKKIVQELSRLFRVYAEGSALESVALKAITVMSILLLQRPARNSNLPVSNVVCTAGRPGTLMVLSWKEAVSRSAFLRRPLGKDVMKTLCPRFLI